MEKSLTAEHEIEARARFGFGANWARFLSVLDDDRIAEAESSLSEMLGDADLQGRRFLDIGSGSGLSSLAARRLGANVRSFDFDPQAVACTKELKRRYFPDDENWQVEQGSALDPDYLASLGVFDIVYSWGVLHHTGAMWLGIEHAIDRVADVDGRLFVAIYNDQGWKSHFWWFVKLIYNRLPRGLKWLYLKGVRTFIKLLVVIKYTIKLRPMTALRPMFQKRRGRGMSAKHDAVDWIGGFPYEFATFDTLEKYFESRGFSLINAKRAHALGCHELVLRRTGPPSG